MWLVGVKLVKPEGKISDLVKYYGDSDSDPLHGCGVDVGKIICHTSPLFGLHWVRVPSKTALASATYPLGTHSRDMSTLKVLSLYLNLNEPQKCRTANRFPT